jgi:hypothetical protein
MLTRPKRSKNEVVVPEEEEDEEEVRSHRFCSSFLK